MKNPALDIKNQPPSSRKLKLRLHFINRQVFDVSIWKRFAKISDIFQFISENGNNQDRVVLPIN